MIWVKRVLSSVLTGLVCVFICMNAVWHRAGLTGRVWLQFYWMWLGIAPGFTAPHFYSVYPLWKKRGGGMNYGWMSVLYSCFHPSPFLWLNCFLSFPTFLCHFPLLFSLLLSSSFSFVLVLSWSSTWEFFCLPVWTGKCCRPEATQNKGERGKEEQKGVKGSK